MALRANENLEFARKNQVSRNQDVNTDLYILQTIVQECRQAKQDTVARTYEAIFKKHLIAFNMYPTEAE
jgi:hypothetical protein